MLDFSVTFVITIVNIVILCVILKALLFKPVTKFMAERAWRVQDTIDRAQQEKKQAQSMLAQYEDKLKKADAEAEVVLKVARDEAEDNARRIVAAGKAEALALVATARRQIEAEQAAAMAKFRAEAAVLVVAAAAQLLQRELNADDDRRFAGQLIEELSRHSAAQKGSV